MAEKKSISEKMGQLESKVDWFYGEDFDLASASEKYKEAVKLADEIEKDLDELKNKIEVIDKDFTKE